MPLLEMPTYPSPIKLPLPTTKPSTERHRERLAPSFDELSQVVRHCPGGLRLRAQHRLCGARGSALLPCPVPGDENKGLGFRNIRIHLVPLPPRPFYLRAIQADQTFQPKRKN